MAILADGDEKKTMVFPGQAPVEVLFPEEKTFQLTLALGAEKSGWRMSKLFFNLGIAKRRAGLVLHGEATEVGCDPS